MLVENNNMNNHKELLYILTGVVFAVISTFAYRNLEGLGLLLINAIIAGFIGGIFAVIGVNFLSYLKSLFKKDENK